MIDDGGNLPLHPFSANQKIVIAWTGNVFLLSRFFSLIFSSYSTSNMFLLDA